MFWRTLISLKEADCCHVGLWPGTKDTILQSPPLSPSFDSTRAGVQANGQAIQAADLGIGVQTVLGLKIPIFFTVML